MDFNKVSQSYLPSNSVGKSTAAVSLSEAVIQGVATQEGVAPEELEPPLYDSIDPDALDQLFHETMGQVSFEYIDYTITVDSVGNVEVSATDR